MPALVDVLIPVFNGARTLAVALGSIQAQTVRDIRIIVVDDGSTDDGGEILAGLAAADPRIHVLRQPNGGIVDALNAGLSLCDAAFVARHDADDLARPDRFARQLDYLAAHADCIAISGAVQHVDADGRPLGHIATLPSPDSARVAWAPAFEPYLMHPFLMLRREPAMRVGGYRYVFHAEDSDLYWRLQEIGRLHNLDAVLGDYRLHPNSITSASARNGRVAAVNSQLAAVSSLRRRAGRADIAFERTKLAEYHSAASMAGMFAVAAGGLGQAEVDHLEIAFAAKMLDLTGYRPFELDLQDARFVRQAVLRHRQRLAPDNQAALDKQLSGTAARLLRLGAFAEAAALAPPRLYGQTSMRLALRVMLPPPLRKRLKKSVGAADFWK